MLIKVREIKNTNLSDVFDTLSNGIDPETVPYQLTYSTDDENIKVGDIVTVNINHRRQGYEENVLALVSQVLTDKTPDDFDFDIKSVLAVVKADGALKQARREARQRELMLKMKARVEKLSQLDAMKKFAESDDEMKQLVDEYESLDK